MVFFLGGTLNYNRPRIPTWAHRSMIVTLTGQLDLIRSHGNETYFDLQLTYQNKHFGFFSEKELWTHINKVKTISVLLTGELFRKKTSIRLHH